MSGCFDCERPYGSEYGFPDLIIPLDTWKRISPTGDEGGLLCPSCICARLYKAGIKCNGAFFSGPIDSLTYEHMYALRVLENTQIELDRFRKETQP